MPLGVPVPAPALGSTAPEGLTGWTGSAEGAGVATTVAGTDSGLGVVGDVTVWGVATGGA